MNVKKDILWRVYLVYGIVCLVGLLIIARAFYIRYFEKLDDGRTWVEYDQEIRKTKQEREIIPLRGNLYSEDGKVLATSYPVYEIRFDALSPSDKDFNELKDTLAEVLSGYFKRRSTQEELDRLLKARVEGSRYMLIARRVTYPQLQEIKEFPLFKKGKYKGGFIVIQQNKRIKPFNRLAHRTIGYVRENVAVGLEGYYDSLLSGVNGRRWEQKIAGGKWIPITDENIIDPVPGSNLHTTLDSYIQDIADNALWKAMEKHQPRHGCVIVMEVATGKIKAISNLARTERGDYFESFNFAVGEKAEPGSTMKLMSAMALLEDGFMDISDSIDIEDGTTTFYDRTLRDSDKKAGGMLSFKDAFAKSSNVFFAKALDSAFKDRPHEYIKYLRQGGLHNRAGVDIKGEPDPNIKDPAVTNHKDPKAWTGITLPWMAIGYELEVAPIQMLNLYNAIANDGKLMRPYLVRRIEQDGNLLEDIQPRVLNKAICSEKTLNKLQTMMEMVVSQGTAKNIKNKYFKIAGKTSTSLLTTKKPKDYKGYQSGFAGYFPADKPIYSCIVVVNAPRQAGYYGNIVAAPVFSEIAQKVYAKKILDEHDIQTETTEGHLPYVKTGNKKDIDQLYAGYQIQTKIQTNKDWIQPVVKEGEVRAYERTVVESLVPNVRGMGLKDALYLLENEGLQVQIVGKGIGKVRSQSIKGGTKVRNGIKIQITVY